MTKTQPDHHQLVRRTEYPELFKGNLREAMTKQETTVALAFMLSEVTGKPVTEIGPLSEYVGTDGLDNLFTKSGTRWLHRNLSVQFQYEEVSVTIHSDGDVSFFCPEEVTN